MWAGTVWSADGLGLGEGFEENHTVQARKAVRQVHRLLHLKLLEQEH